MTLNIANLIADRARAYPERVAVASGQQSWSYGALLERADAVAESLREVFTREAIRASHPRVGLYCANSPEYVALALGILRAGACLIPIASELAIPERDALVASTSLHMVIAGGPRPWLPNPGHTLCSNGIAWAWTTTNHPASFPVERFEALNPAFVRFSSGTTGESKGVVLSHESLLERVNSANRRLSISGADRVLWTLPMAHHFAVSICLYLLNGATVLLEEAHLADQILSVARKENATVIYGAPFHYQLLAAESSGRDWPTLRLAVSTAAPLGLETARSFHARFGKPLCQGLGIIEAGLPLLNTQDALESPLSVGRADDFELQIVDDQGRPCSAGQPGELLLRGTGMFDAYLLPWQERAECTRDGWFATGDIATIEDSGLVFIQGRKKSVINIAGMKLFPEEVEAVLNAHPTVRQSRVCELPHERWGRIPVAQVIPRDPSAPPSSAELRDHCRQRLAAYKVPLNFELVDDLPRTASGKLRR